MELNVVDNFDEKLYESDIENEVGRMIDEYNKNNKKDSVLFVLTLIIMITIVAVFTFMFKGMIFSFILPVSGVLLAVLNLGVTEEFAVAFGFMSALFCLWVGVFTVEKDSLISRHSHENIMQSNIQ